MLPEFALAAEIEAIQQLMKTYRNIPMSLADACLVRICSLSEIPPKGDSAPAAAAVMKKSKHPPDHPCRPVLALPPLSPTHTSLTP